MGAVWIVLVALVALAAVYRVGRARALRQTGGRVAELHSLPGYYGLYVALWCGLPALAVVAAWPLVGPAIVEHAVVDTLSEAGLTEDQLALRLVDVQAFASGDRPIEQLDPTLAPAVDRYLQARGAVRASIAVLALALAIAGAAWSLRRIDPAMPAIHRVEKTLRVILLGCSTVAVFTTVGIVLSLLFETVRFFARVPVTEFLFGLEWSPQTALRADQVASSGAFGAVPLFAGTFLISAIATAVAVPIGLMSAIYMSEYASPRLRGALKPLLEILAGIPTVVYGFYAALTVAPAVRGLGERFGLDVASESALAAGAVMGVMIIPFVSSLSDDVISAVPRGLREASLGLGATRSETIRRVVVPAALPGIVGGTLLAVSRAIGETMIVVMAAGLAANLTANPLEAVTTVTVQIVTLLVGDQEFDSAKTLAAFALGLVLFLLTLGLNVIALHVVRRYREQYE